jgi:hypothetical protein
LKIEDVGEHAWNTALGNFGALCFRNLHFVASLFCFHLTAREQKAQKTAAGA